MAKIDDLEMITFDPAHIEVAKLTPHEAKNFQRLPDSYMRMKELASKSTQAVTIMEDGRIMMMMGFIVIWPGVVEVWLIPTIYAREKAYLFCKSTRRFLEIVADTMKFHRMQAQAIADDQHTSFMTFLGFENEGTLRQYSDAKEDFIQWSRLFIERSV